MGRACGKPEATRPMQYLEFYARLKTIMHDRKLSNMFRLIRLIQGDHNEPHKVHPDEMLRNICAINPVYIPFCLLKTVRIIAVSDVFQCNIISTLVCCSGIMPVSNQL